METKETKREEVLKCNLCRPLQYPIKVTIETKDSVSIQPVLVHVDNYCHLIHLKVFGTLFGLLGVYQTLKTADYMFSVGWDGIPLGLIRIMVFG